MNLCKWKLPVYMPLNYIVLLKEHSV